MSTGDDQRAQLVIAVDDPVRPDVRQLLEAHIALSHEVTPPGHRHVLHPEAHIDPAVSFFSARRDGVLVGVGALRRIDDSHAELKSMHTTKAARRQGIGRAMVHHLLSVASERGYKRVSLETGTMEAFAPARLLYEKIGFRPCAPFGEYTTNPYSVCMTIAI